MKHLITIAFIYSCFFSFGQTSMFWNNYSNFNPAMSGFQYTQHAAITVRETWDWNRGIESIQANYNQRIKGSHGIGINYAGSYSIFASNALKLNYNYQFNFNKAGKLSVGTGMGFGNSRIREKYIPAFDPFGTISPQNYLLLNFGTAYSWKNLIAGVSMSNITIVTSNTTATSTGPRIGWNAHLGYGFQLSRAFQLTPRMIYATTNGFHRLGSNLTATYKSKFALGVSYNFNSQFGVNVGWDIKEKFRVAYNYGLTLSQLTNTLYSGRHEFSIGYIIKDKSAKGFVNIGTPAF